MSFKFTKQQEKEFKDMVSSLKSSEEEMKKGLEVYNRILRDAKHDLEKKISSYNDITRELESFLYLFSKEKDDEYIKKSDNWQSSDKGRLIDDWIQGIIYFPHSLEGIDFDFPEEITFREIVDERIIPDLENIELEPGK